MHDGTLQGVTRGRWELLRATSNDSMSVWRNNITHWQHQSSYARSFLGPILKDLGLWPRSPRLYEHAWNTAVCYNDTLASNSRSWRPYRFLNHGESALPFFAFGSKPQCGDWAASEEHSWLVTPLKLLQCSHEIRAGDALTAAAWPADVWRCCNSELDRRHRPQGLYNSTFWEKAWSKNSKFIVWQRIYVSNCSVYNFHAHKHKYIKRINISLKSLLGRRAHRRPLS